MAIEGYLIDPGAGSAMDHVRRDPPGEAQLADIKMRGGSVTPLGPIRPEIEEIFRIVKHGPKSEDEAKEMDRLFRAFAAKLGYRVVRKLPKDGETGNLFR